MNPSRPLAFLDSAALLALSLALLAAASWTHVYAPVEGSGYFDAEAAVAEALQTDTGLSDDELSIERRSWRQLRRTH